MGYVLKDILQVKYFWSSLYPAAFLSKLAGNFQDKLPLLEEGGGIGHEIN